MEEWLKISLVGLVVLITHCLEGITGFGCTVLALPFIVLLLGVKMAVPVLVVLAWVLAAYIIIRSWKNIRWKEFGFIVLFVGLGLPVGIFLFDYCPEKWLLAVLAVFMIGVGFHGFYKTMKHKPQEGGIMDVTAKPEHNWLTRGVLLLGGMVHGAFGTGGPFVVIYATRALPEKTLFRVTLCLLWFSMNTIMMLKWTIAGNVWNKETVACTLTALPFLIGGMLLGDWLHHKVNEYHFRLLVYIVLALSGIVMALKVLSVI